MTAKKKSSKTTDDKLDCIVECLRQMNKRDRIRTIGGFFKGILTLIPIAFLLFSVWYFYQHGDELMAKIARQAAEQAAEVTRGGTSDLMKQLQQFVPQ